MKITPKLVIMFSLIIIITSGSISLFTLHLIIQSNIEKELEEMKGIIENRYLQINNLHVRASEDLVFALKNPKFVEYFELPETKADNIYENGILQYTNNQYEIKTELEQWIYHFQNKFDVDETCLIDKTGQEHTRLVLSKIAPPDELSSEESSAPFFTPSFAKEEGEVHVQYPYLSPDTNRWVFAYTSPVVLENEEKPAFYHFEMPLTIFQEIIKIDHGRMMVIDPQGFVIADSQYDFFNIESVPDADDYFPKAYALSDIDVVDKILKQKLTGQIGLLQYQDIEKQTHHIVFKELPTFGWILAYDKSEQLIFSEYTTFLGDTGITLGVITISITLLSLMIVYVASHRITKPILLLRDATKLISIGKLDIEIDIKGNDELSELTESFKKMTDSIKKTIKLEKELAVEKQRAKTEKLSAMGLLVTRIAHDIRNPLSVINATIENLRLIKDDPEKFEKNLVRSSQAVNRINHQIENVLNFVRNKSPQFEVHSIIKILKSSLTMIIIPDTIKIHFPDNDLTINCDDKLCEIVFYNLIQNSVQAIGNKSGEITIRMIEKDTEIIIEFEDTGSGIPENILKNIFEPLFTTKQTGNGLGLSSCKNIIENLGGKIIVSTNPTIFTITLQK